jgi:hypothetical protein
LSRVGAASIGHGQLMRRYNNNLNANTSHDALELDMYNDYVGGEAFLGDITLRSQVLGGLFFVKPLAIFMANPIARSLSFGAHYEGDLNAPSKLKRDDFGVVLTDPSDNPKFIATRIHGVGGDVEVKPVHIGQAVDIKFYGDFSQLVTFGNGITGGMLGRFNFGTPLMAVRARLEYRNISSEYLPSYFDTFYEIQKLQVITVSPTTFAPTKIDYLRSLRFKGRRSNMYAELTFAIVDKFAISAAYEDGEGELQQSFLLHAEFTALDWLRFFATYHKRNFANFRDLFKLEENTLFYGQVRLEILPILFLNGRVMRTFIWDPGVDFGLGGFRNVLDYRIDLELGWQWG